MQGDKLAKDQEKIQRRLYRKTAHRFGQTYRLHRWWTDAQDARKEGASP